MSGFQQILVGIDLARYKPAGMLGLDAVAESAIRRAEWVAGYGRAPLTFLSVVPDSELGADQAWRLPPSLDRTDPPPSTATAATTPRHVLLELVRRARLQGIEAGAALVSGKGWVEVVREVLRGRYDLLVIGTHDPQGLRRLLLGSTARKLLHECPCPVWVSKPGPEVAPRRILVASDLSPLSDAAVGLGLVLGHLVGAQVHVLDVIEYPLDRLWSTGRLDAVTKTYHRRVRSAAEQALHAQVEQAGGQPPEPSVTVHVIDGDGIPDHAIIQFIHDQRIDLLVLGTVARHGLSGMLLGNTAERLLPEVPCSVLAVKAADFHCTVKVAGGSR
jgi:universal stress protein E